MITECFENKQQFLCVFKKICIHTAFCELIRVYTEMQKRVKTLLLGSVVLKSHFLVMLQVIAYN